MEGEMKFTIETQAGSPRLCLENSSPGLNFRLSQCG